MAQPLSSGRRRFLQRALSGVVGIPLFGALVAMLRRVRAEDRPLSVAIPADVPVGLSVVGAALVSRDEDGRLQAHSARCTHLGCRIDRVAGTEAVCPCHGSRYRADGSVASGPATHPLVPLRVEADPATGGWTAHAS